MDDNVIKSSLTFGQRKWFVLLVRVGIMGIIVLRSVASGDEMGVSDTGLICIGDCDTCPVICSLPPPKQDYTPPITHLSPPPLSYYHSPTPRRPSPPPEKSEPPLSYSYSDTPPPPRPFQYNNYMPPASGQGPPTPRGQYQYSYPYYYFYASEAPFLSSHASIILVIWFYYVVLFFF